MKKHVQHFFLLTVLAAGAMHGINRFVNMTAEIKNLLKSESGDTYDWKNGSIYYTKRGSGSPLLLIHDLTPEASSYEWSRVVRKLEKKHTVYTFDLIGCGRSAKPCLTYTNYLYVQLVNDFIHDIIGEKTDILVSNDSLSFVILAGEMNPDGIGSIVGINPPSLQSFHMTADKYGSAKKVLFELPIIGTFLYNVRMSNFCLTRKFREEYYAKPQLLSSKLLDAYYEAAHMNFSHGRFLMASMEAGYTKNSIEHAVKKMEHPLCLIEPRSEKGAVAVSDAYHKLNSRTEIVFLSNCKKYPQLEIPDKLIDAVEAFLN